LTKIEGCNTIGAAIGAASKEGKVAMVKSELLELWTEKERREGHRITIEEVAEATGLDRKTVSAMFRGETTQFNAKVLAKLCVYFEVEDGATVPFLKFQGTATTEAEAA
jgi:DNA-binding Xre family transcriptional regulator